MPFLARRQRRPELMDQPGLDARQHRQALRGLERINWWSATTRVLWRPLRALARQAGPQSLRVLDLATGAGDIPLRLWEKAQRAGHPCTVNGCDRSPEAVAYARERAAARQAEVGFFPHDVLNGALPDAYDVLTCSLFLHHLDEDQAVDLLQRMGRAAGRLLLVSDLVRSPGGWALAYAGGRLLTTSAVVHTDGPRSVEGAFRVDEVAALAARAGLTGFTLRRHWPCRFLLSWSRP
jgi:SAM-dependent methyltransferase